MYTIYTDGSCLRNPGKGGWAFIILNEKNEEEILISGNEFFTTNNKMEMTAIINALEHILKHKTEKSTLFTEKNVIFTEKVTLFTDSNYVVTGLTSWIKNWKKNNWKTANKAPVKNKELWIELDSLQSKFMDLTIKWIKAHDISYYNNLVDKQARSEALKL